MASNSTMQGIITGNHIGNSTVRSGNLGDGFGIGVDIRDASDAVLSITNNVIQHTADSGVFIESRVVTAGICWSDD